MTHTYAQTGKFCFHIYSLPDWALPDGGCPICGAAGRPTQYEFFSFWDFRRYDETGDPFAELPKHPRGIIGAMMANRLKDAGWLEAKRTTNTEAELWGRLGDDGAYDLEGAFRTAFGEEVANDRP